MPEDIPGGDMESCMALMQDEQGHDEDSAARICEALAQEAQSDHGDPAALRDALERGAGLIADVGVDLVSGVDVPAVDSKWVMTKSGGARKGHDYRANTPILLSKSEDTEKRITYAAAMIPREPDKEGDVVATPTVEKAAHGFLKREGGVDTDHSLIDGEGQPVESWVLKEDRTFDLPGGGEETYGAGTWMLGIEWGADAWERIQSGELTGLSIYGKADHVPLSRSAKSADTLLSVLGKQEGFEADLFRIVAPDDSEMFTPGDVLGIGVDFPNDAVYVDWNVDAWPDDEKLQGSHVSIYDSVEDAEKVAQGDIESIDTVRASTSKSPDTHKGDGSDSGGMGQDSTSDAGAESADTGKDTDADAGGGDGPTLKDVTGELESLAESVNAVKDAVETEKSDEQEAAAMLAESYGMEPGDVLDVLTVAQGKDPEAVIDAVDSIDANSAEEEAKEDGEDDEEDDEEEKSEGTAEKRADSANLGKGGDATGTAAKGVTEDGSATTADSLSYQALAEQHGGDN